MRPKLPAIMESPRPGRLAHRFGSVKVADAVAVAGHEVHVCRYREARTLLRWLVPENGDLSGLRVLDVAAGDGYWAGQARRRGARAVALDLDHAKLTRGSQLGVVEVERHRPRSSGATRCSFRSRTPASTG